METNEAQVGAALRSLHSMGLDSLCYYEEVDRKAAGLERNSCTVGSVLCRPHAGLTGCNRNVKSRDERRLTTPPLTSPRSAVIFCRKGGSSLRRSRLKIFMLYFAPQFSVYTKFGIDPSNRTAAMLIVWQPFPIRPSFLLQKSPLFRLC